MLVVVLNFGIGVPISNVHADGQTVQVGWLSQVVKRTLPLSYLDQPPEDEGIQGARLGVADNDTTGHFTGQSFELVESIAPADGNLAAAFRDLAAKGVRLVVTDLAAADLLRSQVCPKPPRRQSSTPLLRTIGCAARIAGPISFICRRAGQC